MIKKAALITVGIILLVAAVLIYNVNQRFNDMELDTNNIIVDEENSLTKNNLEQLRTPEEPAPIKPPEDFYALLIGLDQRGSHFMLNTDSLIVAHVIPQTHTVKLIAVPRDQKVTSPKGETTKINAVFAEGYQTAVNAARKNPDLLSGKRISIGEIKVHEEYISSGVASLRKTMEQHLGVSIEYSFLIHFNTVVELVDKVGGIEINVDRSMHYTAEFDGTNIHLEKGLQILDGQNALNYARHREDDRGVNYYSSDFDRGRRQQEVITALVKKVASWGNVTKALDLLDIVTSHVKTDMKRTKMVSLLTDFYGDISSESIVSISYPGEWINPYVEVKEDAFKTAMEQFKSIERKTETAAAATETS